MTSSHHKQPQRHQPQHHQPDQSRQGDGAPGQRRRGYSGRTLIWGLCVVIAALLLAGLQMVTHVPGRVSLSSSISATEALPSQLNGQGLASQSAVTTRYVDQDAGFGARVPVGWYREASDNNDDIGFAVSFQSPPTHDEDHYSDYLMVELSPGPYQPVFTQPVDEVVPINIAGHALVRERMTLNASADRSTDSPIGVPVDLVVWRVVMGFADFTVALYAVSEPSEEARVERLFLEFTQAFELYELPFLTT